MATLFKQHHESTWFKISRSWWFEARRLKDIGWLCDIIQETMHDLGFPEPDHKVYMAIGHKEGNHVKKKGYTIRVANNYTSKLCWFIYKAALIRVGANMPKREDGKRFSQEKLQGELEYQVQKRLSNSEIWNWFGAVRKDRKEVDLSYFELSCLDFHLDEKNCCDIYSDHLHKGEDDV